MAYLWHKLAKKFSYFRNFIDKISKNPLAYVEKKGNFSRKRKLHFSDIIFLQLGLMKHSIQNELNAFFGVDANKFVSKSAYCQSRKKLKSTFTKPFSKN
jgi:hypothetical protein